MSNVMWKDVVFYTIKDTLSANNQINNAVDGAIVSNYGCAGLSQNYINANCSHVKQMSDFKAKGTVLVSVFVPPGNLDELSDFVDNAINEKWLETRLDDGQIANVFLRKNSVKVDAKKDNMTFGYQFYAILEDNNL